MRVVVIAAEGKLFSGGHDLKEMTAHRGDADGGRSYFEDVFGRCARLMQSILALPKPVVAEVAGLATAGGCQLVASCDIVVAARQRALRRERHRPRALLLDADGGALAQRQPEDRARHADDRRDDLRGAGARGRARQPRRAGGALRAETDKVVDRLLARPPGVLALGKKAFAEQLAMPIADAYRFATATIVDNMLMEEAEEGIGAFFEKRKPNWPT